MCKMQKGGRGKVWVERVIFEGKSKEGQNDKRTDLVLYCNKANKVREEGEGSK